MSHFNRLNMERKNCVWTTRNKRLLEMCIVQHVEKKSVFTFQPKNTTSFYDCKLCKACCHVLNLPFKDQKPTIMLFGGDGTHGLGESRQRKRKTISFFEEISPPITVTSTKKGQIESKYGINLFVSYWLMI